MPTVTPRRRRRREINVDNFAGGGGASLGLRQAGVPVHIAVNHKPEAVAMHAANHPETVHYCHDVWDVDPRVAVNGRDVGLAWFSPDCRHFSTASGGAPVSDSVRGLAWVVVRWAAAVRPRVIMLENVREFLTWGPLGPDGRPLKEKAGSTWKQWLGRIKALGYRVEWRVLNAADYGAPTHRHRLFIIARRDDMPIVWPEPTHGPGRAHPWRWAAECIDFSLPTYSIFMGAEEARRYRVNRPLADNTMRRIANGTWRYVINAEKPFIIEDFLVRTGHYSNLTGAGAGFRGQTLDKPLGTVCGVNDKALVHPTLMPVGWMAQHYGGMTGKPLTAPLPTVTARDHNALVTAFLHRLGQTGGNGPYTNDVREPLTAVTGKAEHCLTTAHLLKLRGSGGWKRADQPLDTVCAGAPTFGLVASHLTKFWGTSQDGSRLDEPMPTVTAGGLHFGEVRAFLIKYYGTGTGQGLDEPMHTIPATDRFGLVTVEGQDYCIADIGMRMLKPRELARAQGFPDDYLLVGTQEQQVSRIGNSVSPVMARVLAAANMSDTDVIAA